VNHFITGHEAAVRSGEQRLVDHHTTMESTWLSWIAQPSAVLSASGMCKSSDCPAGWLQTRWEGCGQPSNYDRLTPPPGYVSHPPGRLGPFWNEAIAFFSKRKAHSCSASAVLQACIKNAASLPQVRHYWVARACRSATPVRNEDLKVPHCTPSRRLQEGIIGLCTPPFIFLIVRLTIQSAFILNVL
jgi:hypothetical protein